MDGVICVIKTVLETSSCIVNLQQLVPHFNRTKDFLVFISEVSSDTPEKPQVRFELSQTLLDEPKILKEVTLQNLQCSWRQVSLLMQHFHINNTHTPVVNSNKDVYDDLTSVARFDTTGLKLLAWSPVSENKTDRQIFRFSSWFSVGHKIKHRGFAGKTFVSTSGDGDGD